MTVISKIEQVGSAQTLRYPGKSCARDVPRQITNSRNNFFVISKVMLSEDENHR